LISNYYRTTTGADGVRNCCMLLTDLR